MFYVTYAQMVLIVSAIWIIIRSICAIRYKKLSLKREAHLLLVYICIVVVVRFTFCPFGTVNGQIQPLVFDSTKLLPLKVNLIPFIYLFDYPTMRETLLNLIGNTAMFIPLGIVWPAVFKKLDTPLKAILAGFCTSLAIEIIQLPFYDRTSDIDDLVLNTVGYIIGYGIYSLVRCIHRKKKS